MSPLERQIEKLEVTALLVLEECHKTRQMLGVAESPSASRKGKKAGSKVRLKRDRMVRLGIKSSNTITKRPQL